MRWDPRSEKHRALTERLHRPDTDIRLMTEILVTVAQDIKLLVSDWTAAANVQAYDPATACSQDFVAFDDGSVRLCAVETSLASSTGEDGDQADLDDTFPVVGIRFAMRNSIGSNVRLNAFTARLNRRRDGGQPVFAGVWELQIYAVTEIELFQLIPGVTYAFYFFSPVLDPPATSNADRMTANIEDVDFDLRTFGLTLGQLRSKGRFIPSGGELFFRIRAIPSTPDGVPTSAANVAWRHDTAASAVSGLSGVYGIHAYVFDSQRGDGGWRRSGTNADILNFEATFDQYADPTAGYKNLQVSIDLGSAPLSDTELEIDFQDSAPAGTESIAEISDDAGSNWAQCSDGDIVGEDNTSQGGSDLSAVSRQQTYLMRWRAKANTGRDTTPVLFRMGVKERKAYDVSPLVQANQVATWQVDPVSLNSAVGEGIVQVLRDGSERDFQDLATRIVTENPFQDIELRVYAGHPTLDRSAWGRIEILRVDDRKPLAAAEEFTVVSVLEQLKGLIPPFDPVATPARRIPVAYEQQTLDAAIADVVDVQAALPSRYRGQLLQATDTVTNVLTETDALEEVAALSYIDGKAVIASQGFIKAVNLHGPTSPVEIFAREAAEILQFDPGHRRRQPEMFVRFGYQTREKDDFIGEIRFFNTEAIAAIGRARIEEEPLRPPQEVERWLEYDVDLDDSEPPQEVTKGTGVVPYSTVAAKLIGRLPKYLATGLMMVQVRLQHAHPWLELGDAIAISQDLLTARDPITDRQISGRSWVIGIIVEQHDLWGRHFNLWVRGFANVIPGSVAIDRLGFGEPVAWAEEDPLLGQPENARYRFHAWPESNTQIFYIYQAMADVVPDRSPSGTGWTEVDLGDPVIFLRDQSVSKKLTVYAVHQSTMGPPTTIVIGPDKTPTISDLALTQQGVGAGAIDVKVTAAVDADVRHWRVYRRVHATNWPTSDGTQTGPLDETYFEREMHVSADGGGIDSNGNAITGGLSFVDNVNGTAADVVRYIAVPKDGRGNVGPRAAESITLQGTPQPEITSFSTTPSGATCAAAQVVLDWTTSNASDGSQDMKIYRRLDDQGWELLYTETSPVTTTTYTDTNLPIAFTGTGATRKLEYKIELVTGAAIDDQAIDTAWNEGALDCPI